MAIKPILKMGNSALHVVSQPVQNPCAPEIRQLLADMRDTLDSVSGIGIAAPQIGVPLRVILYCIPLSRVPTGASTKPVPWTALINPQIEVLGDERVNLWERCLSLPGLYAKVPRHQHIAIRYQTPEGEWLRNECHGYHATLLQHEYDHLDGILYPSKMKQVGDLVFASEVCGDKGVFEYDPIDFDGTEAKAF